MDDDIYELENDVNYKGTIDLKSYSQSQFNDIYKRDHKLYLNSIEWDTWCTREPVPLPEPPPHPFNKFF